MNTRPGAQYATDRYGILFLLLFAVFSFAAFAEESRLVRTLLGLLVVAVVTVTFRSIGTSPRLMRLIRIGAVLAAATILAGGFSGSRGINAAVALASAILLGVGSVALIRRIFEHEQVTLPLVVAALAAYLQVALVFSFTYGALIAISDGDFFAQGAVESTSALYFSVVTMTTLGYGDLTPVTDVGRALAMIQTLFGQIFLVVLVAYLVGSLGRERPRLREE